MSGTEEPVQGVLDWRKSPWSGGNGGSCVELAPLPDGGVAVRDSKQKGEGPMLTFTRAEWIAFFRGVWTARSTTSPPDQRSQGRRPPPRSAPFRMPPTGFPSPPRCATLMPGSRRSASQARC